MDKHYLGIGIWEYPELMLIYISESYLYSYSPAAALGSSHKSYDGLGKLQQNVDLKTLTLHLAV